MTTTDITVAVPDERVPEFYQYFGLWLAGSLSLATLPPEGSAGISEGPQFKPWENLESDLEDAALLWEKFSRPARAMFGLLIENPGKEFTGGQIAEAVDISNGAHGVAGVLAWPGRYGKAIGRGLPSFWRVDHETMESFYSMSKERADLFRAAREKVEGGAA